MPTTAAWTYLAIETVRTEGAAAVARLAQKVETAAPTSTGLRPTLSARPPMIGELKISVRALDVASAVSTCMPRSWPSRPGKKVAGSRPDPTAGCNPWSGLPQGARKLMFRSQAQCTYHSEAEYEDESREEERHLRPRCGCAGGRGRGRRQQGSCLR
eukprot:1899046-Prymnesium_polylepis.2